MKIPKQAVPVDRVISPESRGPQPPGSVRPSVWMDWLKQPGATWGGVPPFGLTPPFVTTF